MKKILFVSFSFVISLLFLSCEKENEIENNKDRNITYSYIQNCVDSLDAVLTSEGYLALCGITEVQNSEINSVNKYRSVYITKADYEKGDVDHSEDLYVLLDSLNYPVSITTSNCTYTIMNNNGSTFDLMYIDDKNEPKLYSNIPLNSTKSRANTATRAAGDLASSEPIPFTGLDDIMNAIGKMDNMYNIITATTTGQKISAGLGTLANLIGDAGWAEGGLFTGGISDALAGSLRSSYLALAGYMWSENQKFILKHLGAWRISIQSIEQRERGSLEIGYTVEGLNVPTEGRPKINLLCQNLKTRKYQTISLGSTTNGVYTYTISNLVAGQYGIEMRLYDECHSATNISVMTYPQVKANVYDLGLNRVEVEDNPLYYDGAVNFDLNIYLDGSEEGLQDIREFGYYIKFANSIDYHKVEHLSYIFESTPLTCDLRIEKEGFFNLDYNNYIAEATDYYIGVYVVNKKGDQIFHYDEQRIENLIYNEKPYIRFTNCNISGTHSIGSDNGNIQYQTDYEFDTEVKGTFWYNRIQMVIVSSNVNNSWNEESIYEDGVHSRTGWYRYWSNSYEHHSSYYQMYLNNGGVETSDNSLVWGGSIGSPTLSISNTRSNATTRTKSSSVINRNTTFNSSNGSNKQ